MKTTAITIQTLSVPCACHCRYCLLDWNGQLRGADYARCEAYAKRFREWLAEHRPEIEFNFAFGYSMEHPQLPNALDFMNSIGSVSGQFLQLDGLQFRTTGEQKAFFGELKQHGIRNVNFTFYGLSDYHDAFCGRKGDFSYMLEQIRSAAEADISVSVGIPLTAENAEQIDPLLNILEQENVSSVFLFIPHEEGRGKSLAPVRMTLRRYEELNEHARGLLDRGKYMTEGEWYQTEVAEEENRALLISLTPENIERFEKMSIEEAIRHMEVLDDAYYAAVPSFRELLARYGDPAGEKLYGKRDLYQHYQKRYIRETNLAIYDVTDERLCGSRRY